MDAAKANSTPGDYCWFLLSFLTQALLATLLVVFFAWSNSWHDINEALVYFFDAHWNAVAFFISLIALCLTAILCQCGWLFHHTWRMKQACLEQHQGTDTESLLNGIFDLQSDQESSDHDHDQVERDDYDRRVHSSYWRDSETLLGIDRLCSLSLFEGGREKDDRDLGSEELRFFGDSDEEEGNIAAKLSRRTVQTFSGLIDSDNDNDNGAISISMTQFPTSVVVDNDGDEPTDGSARIVNPPGRADAKRFSRTTTTTTTRQRRAPSFDTSEANNVEALLRPRPSHSTTASEPTSCSHFRTSIHWCHWVFVSLVFVVTVVGYVLLAVLDQEQWGLYYRFMQVSLPIAQTVLALGCSSAVLLLYPLLTTMKKLRWTSALWITAVLYAAVLCFVLTIPLWIDTLNVRDPLTPFPPAPRLFAHRGVSSLAPENTAPAYRRVRGFDNVHALESDVHWTKDFHPVLVHDDSLFRTTNVASVFPGRERDRIETFTYEELQRLDAGSWFVETDPFGTIKDGSVTPAEAEAYRGTKIPNFADYVRLAVELNKPFLWDNYGRDNGGWLDCSGLDCALPRGNITCLPFSHACVGRPGNWYMQLANIIVALGAEHLARFYLIPEVDDSKISEIRRIAPAMQFAFYFGSDYPLAWVPAGRINFTLWNAPFGVSDRAIALANEYYPEVVVFNLNERWVVDQAWLAGTGYFLSNFIQNFDDLGTKPTTWTMSYPVYYGLWISVDLLSIAIILVYVSWKHSWKPCRRLAKSPFFRQLASSSSSSSSLASTSSSSLSSSLPLSTSSSSSSTLD